MQEFINPTLEKLKKKQVFGKSCTIPGQTFTIREILLRFQNGQRLAINQRDMNPMVPFDPEHPELDVEGDERFDDVCPQCGNFEDLQLALQEEQAKRHQRVADWHAKHPKKDPEPKPDPEPKQE